MIIAMLKSWGILVKTFSIDSVFLGVSNYLSLTLYEVSHSPILSLSLSLDLLAKQFLSLVKLLTKLRLCGPLTSKCVCVRVLRRALILLFSKLLLSSRSA